MLFEGILSASAAEQLELVCSDILARQPDSARLDTKAWLGQLLSTLDAVARDHFPATSGVALGRTPPAPPPAALIGLIKVKKAVVRAEEPETLRYWRGCGFSKHVAHRAMRSAIDRPRVLLVGADVPLEDPARAEGAYFSFAPGLAQAALERARDAHARLVASLVARGPDVLVSSACVSRDCVAAFAAAGIAVLARVRPESMRRLAALCRTEPVGGNPEEQPPPPPLGSCARFEIREQRGGGTGSNDEPRRGIACFYAEEGSRDGGGLLLVSARTLPAAALLKRLCKLLLFAVHHLRLEHLLLRDFLVQPTAAAGERPREDERRPRSISPSVRLPPSRKSAFGEQNLLVLQATCAPLTQVPCGRPRVYLLEYYLEGSDAELGGFLRDIAADAARVCGSRRCLKPMAAHTRVYAHAAARVTVRVRAPASADSTSSSSAAAISSWAECGVCGAHSPHVLLHSDVAAISLGKFLELLFYDDTSTLQLAGGGCTHPVMRDSTRLFALGDGTVVAFARSAVRVWALRFPLDDLREGGRYARRRQAALDRELSGVRSDAAHFFASLRAQLPAIAPPEGVAELLHAAADDERALLLLDDNEDDDDEYTSGQAAAPGQAFALRRRFCVAADQWLRIVAELTAHSDERRATGRPGQPRISSQILKAHGVQPALGPVAATEAGRATLPSATAFELPVLGGRSPTRVAYGGSGAGEAQEHLEAARDHGAGADFVFPERPVTPTLLTPYEAPPPSAAASTSLKISLVGKVITTLWSSDHHSHKHLQLPAWSMENLISETFPFALDPRSPASQIAFAIAEPLHASFLAAKPSEQQQHAFQHSMHCGAWTFDCSVQHAREFHGLRVQLRCEDDFAESLARSAAWDAKGGKSNSKFAKTEDDRFVIKEISRTEFDSFLTFAPAYLRYVADAHPHETHPPSGGPRSLLARVVGAFRLARRDNETGRVVKANVVVMQNVFVGRASSLSRTLDLKGSTRNRRAQHVNAAAVLGSISASEHTSASHGPSEQHSLPAEPSRDHSEVLMDEDLAQLPFDETLLVQARSKEALMAAVKRDADFLAAQNVMDYSLVVGVDPTDSSGCLVVAIVDFLRTFTWDKRLESWVKETGLLGGGGAEPTVISPDAYNLRFQEAMANYFYVVPDKG